MSVEIISVHVPKSAGTSLVRSLKAVYGSAAIHLDYADDPIDPCCSFNLDPAGCRMRAQQIEFDPVVRVIHGHLHASKYAHLRDAKRITFLRHPISNLISIHSFWKTLAEGGPLHCLFQYCRRHDLSLLDFARLPAIRYLFSRTYFGGVDLAAFDFVGSMENYSADLQRLSRMLGVALAETRKNTNSDPAYSDAVRTILDDVRLVAGLRDLLAEDIALYEAAVPL
jgi:hypothetical protein